MLKSIFIKAAKREINSSMNPQQLYHLFKARFIKMIYGQLSSISFNSLDVSSILKVRQCKFGNFPLCSNLYKKNTLKISYS